MKSNLTVERLRERLHYNCDTGIFTWPNGRVAGCRSADGYLSIRIDGTIFRANRLAWLWMTGEWPIYNIDHADSDFSNDRWGNLRLATQSQNSANRRIASNNSSGIKGVSWYKKYGKWAAHIKKNGRREFLGYFENIEDASAAYATAAVKLFGEFARAA